MAKSSEKIARILRTDKDNIAAIETGLERKFGKSGVLDKIIADNDKAINSSIERLGVRSRTADVIYGALIDKIKKDDQSLLQFFDHKKRFEEEGYDNIAKFAMSLAKPGKGYFLKVEKAREFLIAEPPRNILAYFKCQNAEELLEKHDLFEVYSALRFIEDREWLNDVFFKQLEGLTPDDFEERGIQTKVLPAVWLEAAESFLKKKYHNVSHLKELGIIFIIPLKINASGEATRLFTLLLHYIHEVSFYSNLFQKFAADSKGSPANFAQNLIASLRGDVLEKRPADGGRGDYWIIVQRYLAKEDPYDWRLFAAHVNPEAIHWSKAEDDFAKLDKMIFGIDFWNNLDHVGDYFQDTSGVEILVPFNLIDSVMSLVKEKEMIKYLYHQQEALWNRIFAEYVGGRDKMEQMVVENFTKGYIEL